MYMGLSEIEHKQSESGNRSGATVHFSFALLTHGSVETNTKVFTIFNKMLHVIKNLKSRPYDQFTKLLLVSTIH